MSITPAGLAQSTTSNQTVECVLTESSTFIETLTLQSIAAQPGLVELVTHTPGFSLRKIRPSAV